MKVKICGITRKEDLKTLEEFDPAFIGFINIKRSLRYVNTDEINELKHSMINTDKSMLVIRSGNVEEVIKKAKQCDIKNVQLHSLSPEEISKINGINIIRAIGISENIDEVKSEEIKQFSRVCNYLLFDSMISGKSGGTIKAAEIARKSNPNIKLFLAGGMDKKRIKNEGRIIKSYFDYVDVNSGVENRPGYKNRDKIEEFMESCKVI